MSYIDENEAVDIRQSYAEASKPAPNSNSTSDAYSYAAEVDAAHSPTRTLGSSAYIDRDDASSEGSSSTRNSYLAGSNDLLEATLKASRESIEKPVAEPVKLIEKDWNKEESRDIANISPMSTRKRLGAKTASEEKRGLTSLCFFAQTNGFQPPRPSLPGFTTLHHAPPPKEPIGGIFPVADLPTMAEFQQILEETQGVEKYRRLSDLAHDFCYAAQIYGKIIISEVNLPTQQKTIPPVSIGGIAGGQKFMAMNILFKFALDTEGLYGSDEAAMKSASNELKGLVSYYNANISGICFPLMALIDYRGYRLTAVSVLPVNKSTIIYGSHDGGKEAHAADEEFNERMKHAAKILNLKPHIVGSKRQATLYSCGDIEGHLSQQDGRYYLLDFGRVFPPQLKLVQDNKRRHLYELLRPELVASYTTPLSSDALTGWGINDSASGVHNEEVRSASHWLLEKVIPEFAARLGRYNEAQLAKLSITDELHQKGINARHLGRVRAAIDLANVPLRKRILNECLARCLKSELNEKLRDINKELRVPLEEPYRKAVLEYLNKALRPSKKWWKQMRGVLADKFNESLTADEQTDPMLIRNQVNIIEVLARFQQLAGVRLSDQAMAELMELRPGESFALVEPDLVGMEATVRHMNLIEHSSGFVLSHEAMKSKGREADRLFILANAKFSSSLARAPNSLLTLIDWAKMLHQMALRTAPHILYGESANLASSFSPSHLKLTPQSPPLSAANLPAAGAAIPTVAVPEKGPLRLPSFAANKTTSVRGIRRQSSQMKSVAGLNMSSSDQIDPSDIRLVSEASAEEQFRSAEEKFKRAQHLHESHGTKLMLSNLLFDMVDFFLQKAPTAAGSQPRKAQLKEAKTRLTEALRLNSTKISVYTTRAQLYADYSISNESSGFKGQKHWFDNAAVLYSSLLKIDPRNSNLHFKYANALVHFYCGCVKKRRVKGTEKFAKKIATHWQQSVATTPDLLKRIQASIINADFPAFAEAFSGRCKTISTLNLQNMLIEEQKVLTLMKQCVNTLTGLNLMECRVSDNVVTYVAQHCTGLQSLCLRGCKLLTSVPVLPDTTQSEKNVMAALTGGILAKANSITAIDTSLQGGLLSRQLKTSVAADKRPKAKTRGYVSASPLQFIDLSNCPLIESRAIGLLEVFESLNFLDLSGVNKLLDEDLSKVLNSCTHLEQLFLSNCILLTPLSVNLCVKLNKLKALSVANCKALDEKCILSIVTSCIGLASLDCSHLKFITDEVLRIVAKCSGIKTVIFENCDAITDSGVKKLASQTGLQKICLGGCTQITNKSINILAKACFQLQELQLNDCPTITSEPIVEICKALKGLTSLDLRNCVCIETGIKDLLISCPLSSLKLGGCRSLRQDTASEIQSAFKSSKLKNMLGGGVLTKLDWAQVYLADDGLEKIVSACPSITDLNISGVRLSDLETTTTKLTIGQCTRLTDVGLGHLAKLLALKSLQMDELHVTDVGLTELAESVAGRNLEFLSLRKCSKITDDSLMVVGTNCLLLKTLYLEGNRGTIESLAHILEFCSELSDLFVCQCEFVDNGALKRLANDFDVKALVM